MKIALGQINVIAGQPSINVNRMMEMIDEVRGQADCIVFPEMCVSGYFLQDRYQDSEWMNYIASFNEKIKQYSTDIIVVWGNIYQEHGSSGRDGRPARMNGAYAAYNGQWLKRASGFKDGLYIKHLNPDYRVFDDSRYFLSGLEYYARHQLEDLPFLEPFLVTVNQKTIHLGLQICEDLWSEDYVIDPTRTLIERGADVILNISSSPWTRDKEYSRIKQIRRHQQHFSAFPYFVYANVCGMQNNGKTVLMFDGGSSVFTREAAYLDGCNQFFEEECKIVDLDGSIQPEQIVEDKLCEALIHAIREFDRQIFPFRPHWIIGVSGGLDSSVNLALLVMALGAQRVIGVNMATQYNQSTSIKNARTICECLGVAVRFGIIDPLVNASEQVMSDYGYQNLDSLTQENIQARIRGHLLSAIASAEHGVIANNGNKIETALGYATLYGDLIGALSILGDCTKLQVVELGYSINRRFGQEIIPANLLAVENETGITWEFAPSAELKENQVDPMKWGYHDLLVSYLTEYPTYRIETLMREYYSGTISETPFAKWISFYHLTPRAFIEDLEWVLRTMQNAVFKRIQAPPIVMVSRGSFGFDFRENQMILEQSDEYRILREKIIAMEEMYETRT